MPRQLIDGIRALRTEHIETLDKMIQLANDVVQQHRPHEFKIGFHAVPSIRYV